MKGEESGGNHVKPRYEKRLLGGGGGEGALTCLSGRGIKLIYSLGKTDTNCSAVAVRNIFSSLKGGMCV
jgi:hypothetical protein